MLVRAIEQLHFSQRLAGDLCHLTGKGRFWIRSALAQEASNIPADKKVVSAGSIDAASTAQFVRHLEEDPLIQPHRDAGGLPRGDPHSDNLTNGLRAGARPSPLASLQLPILTQDTRSRLMSILWANWEVSATTTVLLFLMPCLQRANR